MKIFVTGGGGFLGHAIVQKLVKEGYEVISFSRGSHKELELRGIRHFRGNLSDYDTLKSAMHTCDAVFHVAAKTSFWGSFDSFYEANVIGTENVLRACRELGIPYLIYSSSASVVYQGSSEGRDESLPYPAKFYSFYPQTKAIAERIVLKSNTENLTTCALRPHLVWGPGDPHILPRLLDRRRKGTLRVVGKKQYYTDTIYIENAAHAHILAFKAMQENRHSVAGKAYFVSQQEPVTIRSFIDRLLEAGGCPPVDRSINANIALAAGWLLQNVYRYFITNAEPPYTVFLVKQLSSSHWFDISASIRDFGYSPVVSIDEGMKRLKTWVEKGGLQHLPGSS